MRFVTWFLIAALLISWPELTAVLAETVVYALTTPWTLTVALLGLAVRRVGLRVQKQARGARRFV